MTYYLIVIQSRDGIAMCFAKDCYDKLSEGGLPEPVAFFVVICCNLTTSVADFRVETHNVTSSLLGFSF